MPAAKKESQQRRRISWEQHKYRVNCGEHAHKTGQRLGKACLVRSTKLSYGRSKSVRQQLCWIWAAAREPSAHWQPGAEPESVELMLLRRFSPLPSCECHKGISAWVTSRTCPMRIIPLMSSP